MGVRRFIVLPVDFADSGEQRDAGRPDHKDGREDRP
jgi:hypothetical protein